jgi:hypothetical protein
MISFLLNGSWKVWDTQSFGPSLAADDKKLEFASSSSSRALLKGLLGFFARFRLNCVGDKLLLLLEMAAILKQDPPRCSFKEESAFYL